MSAAAPFAAIMRDGRARVRDVRLLVTTPLAFRPPRLPFFLDMVRCFAEMPVAHVTFFILVNTEDPAALAVLEGMLAPFRGAACRVEVRPAVGLDEAYALCWQHKELFASEFFPGDYTHFVYLEDDMRFGLPNMEYFLGAREALRPFGLVPSFVRWEWNTAEGAAYATDQVAPVHQWHVPTIEAGDHVFLPVPSVYCACFVMDRELAAEYVATRSFDRHRSNEVFGWQISERAAMGLAFENPPPGYYTRYRVPVPLAATWAALPCWVQHWPGNFTNDPNTVLGSLPMRDMFVLGTEPTSC